MRRLYRQVRDRYIERFITAALMVAVLTSAGAGWTLCIWYIVSRP